ncbi:hypothetical protein AAVH_14747 [Aphelenchoides avenae]|nr:hypothetical protein AAVH_14747 [Aphelenchus avenae]
MFSKYRTLLVASTVTNIVSRIWTSVLMQPVMVPGFDLTAVTGPICRLGPWSANFANVTLIFFLSAAPMPSILTFIYRYKLMTTDDQFSVNNRSTAAIATALVLCIPAVFTVGYALSLVPATDAKDYLATRYPGIEPFLRSGICIYAYDARHYTFQIVLGIQVIVVTALEALCFALACRIFNVLQQHSKVLSARTYRQQKQFNVMLLSDSEY